LKEASLARALGDEGLSAVAEERARELVAASGVALPG
jgi:hypothetical protein